mmetsp:Transcript_34755/g.67610  ORF Transcript_34755/g.67610 Transcript_34755/m.67610 type:complete len:346 (-) Transcript_34755:186-1223(-)
MGDSKGSGNEFKLVTVEKGKVSVDFENSILEVDDGIVEETIAKIAKKGGKLVSVTLASSRRITNHALICIARNANHLKTLNIAGCRPDRKLDEGLLSICEAASGLKELDISGCILDTKTLKKVFKSSRKLETLKMNGLIRDSRKHIIINEIGKEFHRLSSLLSLEINSCMPSFSALKTILHRTGGTLQRLHVANAAIGSEDFRTLFKYCEQLIEINLNSCTHVDDAALATLCSKNVYLRSVNVTMTKVSDAGIQFLVRKLKNLENICLYNCHNVTDKGIAELSKCKKLQVLDIFGLTHVISISTLEKLATACPKLRRIDCGGCGVTPDLKERRIRSFNSSCSLAY